MKILVVDDHAVVRAGLRNFLADAPDMQIAGDAANSDEALRLIREQDWHVVLLDISLPHKSGIEILKQIKREKPNLPVLVLSMHPESRYAVQLLRNGASGYLQKEALAGELIAAIRTVVVGRKYVSPAVAQLLALDIDQSGKGPLHATLSEREFQIFCRLAEGQGPTRIAEELSLSVKTVSTYRVRILEKMKMASNADLMYYAIKNDLVD
ncbi:MAG: response regulator transcription factor [Betaproteobacteria bacterium]|nr:response regulator transcription factor [Betaproteobacteria bacterium]